MRTSLRRPLAAVPGTLEATALALGVPAKDLRAALELDTPPGPGPRLALMALEGNIRGYVAFHRAGGRYA